jgi:hypothetical protein
VSASSLRVALPLALTVATLAPSAAAYCRTTTCDPEDPTQTCTPDAAGCIREGIELGWPEQCLSFGVQKDGSVKRHITYGEADAVVQDAFRQWIGVDCDGQPPSFSIYDLGAPHGGIDCSQPEFNEREPNANVWMFRDSDWPYPDGDLTLALTTVTFDATTGDILDADVEINSYAHSLTIGDTNVGNDLLSIVTHEAGHFLGLSHSNVATATMSARYSPHDIGFRTLAVDDVDGICAIYPPNRDAPACDASGPTPHGGFSVSCGTGVDPTSGSCAVTPLPEPPDGPRIPGTVAVVTLLGLAVAGARRR